MATAPVDSSLYADPKGLNALKLDAKTQSPQSLRAAARQFESLFTSMMLKSMRQATPKDSLMGSDQQDFYQDMFDQQMSVQLSKGKGMGLADMLVKQLMQNGGSDAPLDTSVQKAQSPLALPQSQSPGLNLNATPAAQPLKLPNGIQPTAANWPPATHEEFIQALLPAAKAAGEQLGVDPSTLIAHAALETGWGKSMPTAADGTCSFNLFGIKAGKGYGGDSVSAVTKEFDNGALQTTRAQFRAYASPADCMRDYAALLTGSDRYAGALGTGADSSAFATALQQGGYATDPDYANKLSSIAQELKLRIDPPITAGDAA
jgi:peptidoglycan hydrolase FlgJ